MLFETTWQRASPATGGTLEYRHSIREQRGGGEEIFQVGGVKNTGWRSSGSVQCGLQGSVQRGLQGSVQRELVDLKKTE